MLMVCSGVGLSGNVVVVDVGGGSGGGGCLGTHLFDGFVSICVRDGHLLGWSGESGRESRPASVVNRLSKSSWLVVSSKNPGMADVIALILFLLLAAVKAFALFSAFLGCSLMKFVVWSICAPIRQMSSSTL